jgi:hypothetical protein
MSYFVVSAISLLVGLVLGWLIDRWTLQARSCEDCGGEAPIDVISWRCSCGWTKAEEEL